MNKEIESFSKISGNSSQWKEMSGKECKAWYCNLVSILSSPNLNNHKISLREINHFLGNLHWKRAMVLGTESVANSIDNLGRFNSESGFLIIIACIPYYNREKVKSALKQIKTSHYLVRP